MYTIVNHDLLRDGLMVDQRPSPNHAGTMTPSLLVMHYTGAQGFDGALRTLTDSGSANRVSAHLLIGRDGRVAQMLPFNFIGWHAGKSSWAGRSNCNAFSIGIEMQNCGLIERAANGYADRLQHKPVPSDQVVIARHSNGSGPWPWQTYTRAQIDAATGAARAICAAYHIRAIAGHEDIAPLRKVDPGPAWPMAQFVKDVLGAAAPAGGPAPPPAAAPAGHSGPLHPLASTRGLQEALNELGAAPHLDVDDDFGDATETAVINFQARSGLTPDGLVGPRTIFAITAALAAKRRVLS